MKSSRPIVVAVSGGGRDSGKTTLVCGLLSQFPNAAAVKWIAAGEGRGHAVGLCDEKPSESGKDTARMKAAGARCVALIRGSGRGEAAKLKKALGLVRGHSPVFVEGAAAVRHGSPDLKIFVEKSGEADKTGSGDMRGLAHLVVGLKSLPVQKIASMIRTLGRDREARMLRAVLARTRGGTITCSAARATAARLKVAPAAVGRLCNRAGIRIDDCVLGCFGRFKEKKKKRVAALGRGLTAKQKVWIEKGGRMVMGEGRANLLRAVEQEGSINRGAKKIGLSFRRAWAMIHTMEERTGRKIVSTVIGGPEGGGSSITPYGKELLRQYEKLSLASRILLEEKMKGR